MVEITDQDQYLPRSRIDKDHKHPWMVAKHPGRNLIGKTHNNRRNFIIIKEVQQ